jgi:hypothetical protein
MQSVSCNTRTYSVPAHGATLPLRVARQRPGCRHTYGLALFLTIPRRYTIFGDSLSSSLSCRCNFRLSRFRLRLSAFLGARNSSYPVIRIRLFRYSARLYPDLCKVYQLRSRLTLTYGPSLLADSVHLSRGGPLTGIKVAIYLIVEYVATA